MCGWMGVPLRWFAVLTVDTQVSAAATSRALTKAQVAVVKFVLSSGQYPRLAAPDRGNLYRNSSEQVFHTMTGQQVLLHPSSCLQAVLAEQRLAGAAAASTPATAVATIDGTETVLELTQTELLCFGKVGTPRSCCLGRA